MEEIIGGLIRMAPPEIVREVQGSMSTMTSTELLRKIEQSKVDSYNAEIGNLKDYDCPLCKNKGFVGVLRNGLMAVEECGCMNRRRSMRLLNASGLSNLMHEYTFDKYQTPSQWQKSVKNKAVEFVKRGKGWFVIVGHPGTGKTHICTAICGMFLEQNKAVRYMVWREEAPRIKASINDRETYEKMLGGYKDADVLYIDDFWKGTVTDADINLSFELLNYRYNDRNKITIISGEKDIEQMLEIDEAIGSRIYEMSKGFQVKTQNENWRLR